KNGNRGVTRQNKEQSKRQHRDNEQHRQHAHHSTRYVAGHLFRAENATALFFKRSRFLGLNENEFKKRPFVGLSVFSRSGSYRGTSATGTGDLHQTRPVTHA